MDYRERRREQEDETRRIIVRSLLRLHLLYCVASWLSFYTPEHCVDVFHVQ